MELLRSVGESESKKRKLEELFPTPSPEFNSRDSSESERKNRNLEELLHTPSPEFNSSDSSESEWELVPPSPEFNSRDSSDSSKEEDIIRKEEEKKKELFSEEVVYFNETEFRKEGEFNILQRVSRRNRELHEYFQRIDKEMSEEAKGAREFFGAYTIAGWFCHDPYPSPNAFLSKFTNLDAETLKSHLQDGINSEYLGIPDWEELAKYVNQLQDDEGFDLDEYKNLANYNEELPVRLSGNLMIEYEKILDACMEAAMKLYENAGGGELKEGKVINANGQWQSLIGEYYITFRAKSCLDGKERHYQAIVVYNEDTSAVLWGEMMVRIKKGY